MASWGEIIADRRSGSVSMDYTGSEVGSSMPPEDRVVRSKPPMAYGPQKTFKNPERSRSPRIWAPCRDLRAAGDRGVFKGLDPPISGTGVLLHHRFFFKQSPKIITQRIQDVVVR